MATVVLTAVGTVLGGPVGGAIGALAGSAIDSRLLTSSQGRRGGPRLAELAVQTSSYGTAVPQIFGRMRVAGTVIWATDLKETTSSSGGGKGGRSSPGYSYSVSFAVAVSSRPIASVRRIWADGKLLRGEAGDLKVACELRVHNGHGDQASDPLIASAEGPGRAPAHRGLAYAVFEDLQLADYGNRIPSLTFEVIEREVPVSVLEIASAAGLAAGLFAGPELVGYAMAAHDARSALIDLADGAGCDLASSGMAIVTTDPAVEPAAEVPIVVSADGRTFDAVSVNRAPASASARRLDLRFYDVATDYQAGVASAERAGPGRRVLMREWPAVLTGGQAQAIAAGVLLETEAGRDCAELVTLPQPGLTVGAVVTIAGQRGRWQVQSIERGRSTCRLTFRRRRDAGIATASAGRRIVSEADLPAGSTTLTLFELPSLGPDLQRAPVIVAAAGGGAGWRGAALSRVLGDARTAIGGVTRAAVLGRVLSPPLDCRTALLDRASRIEVALPDRFQLHDADADALRSGSNLAMIGRELIQFSRAVPLASGRWQLFDVCRGLAGTDAWIGAHAIGEPFMLLDRGALVPIDAPSPYLSEMVSVEAMGIGDAIPIAASIEAQGAATRPLPPVHCRLTPTDTGIAFSWIRRDRLDLGWQDGADQNAGEDGQRFEVSLVRGHGAVSKLVVVDGISITFTTADLAGVVTVEIAQIGRDGRSDLARLSIAS